VDRFLGHLFKKRGYIAVAVFTMVFIATSTIMALPRHNNAYADGALLILTPPSAAYASGGKIKVQGSGYASNESVQIYWNHTGPGTGILETTTTANATGVFSASFVMPLASTGSYPIVGIGQQSGLVAMSTFQLLPRLLLPTTAGGSVSNLKVHGNSYGAGEQVSIYWNYTGPGTGKLLTNVAADSTGSFSTAISVPVSAIYGSNPVAGIGQTSNTMASAYYILYAPTLALAPLSGSAGTQLTISAYGFNAFEKVKIYWNNGSSPVLALPASTYGYVALTTFTVPMGTPPGSYPMTAIGSLSHLTITNTFNVVAPGSTLSVTSGPVGVAVNLAGQGYAPGENVNVLWNYTGPGTGTNVASVFVGLSGTISAAFTVPVVSTGSYTVAAVGKSSSSVIQNSFNVSNGLASSPKTTPPGTNVTVSGTGFQANEPVNLYWKSLTSPVLGAATADANGNISAVVQTPTTASSGTNSLIAVGQTSGTSYTIPVTIDTDWTHLGFNMVNHRQNYYENALNTANVGQLKLKWKANLTPQANSLFQGFPSPVYANNFVYIASDYGVLQAYNATTGTLVWQYNMGMGFANLSSPLVDPVTNLVYFGTVGEDYAGIPAPFYALNATTGQVVWSVILTGGSYAFPNLAFNTLYLGTSGNENAPSNLYAIDEMTGHIQWQYHTAGGVWGSVGIDVNTNMVFTGIGNPTPAVAALNATTGAQIWFEPIPAYSGDDDVGSAITVDNGIVYANCKQGSVFALNESSGAVIWSTPIGMHSNADVSSQVVANGTLYAASLSGFLYAMNETTGVVLWKKFLSGGLFSSPALANGVLYIAGKSFFAIDPTSGHVLWSYNLGVIAYSSPVVVNGWFYCASNDGNLYAFSL
jgi:outer membrane protein assembly factor BamB